MARFNIEFTDDAAAMLEQLAKRQGSSKADVLRRAIALEKWFQDNSDEGARILVEKPDGRTRELVRM